MAKREEMAGKYFDPKIGYQKMEKVPGDRLNSDAAHGGGGAPQDANETATCHGIASPGMSEQMARKSQKWG